MPTAIEVQKTMTGSSFRDEVRALGTDITPQMFGACAALYARFAPDAAKANVQIERDVAYGPHERHRLDIFTSGDRSDGSDRPALMPVLIYVHGGGFVAGDKTLAGTPFYDNIGIWAAQQGFVGVTMTYRLAPDHPWPAGAQDVAAAIAWLRRNIAARGGSPDHIFVAGQSAGATHVASYLAMTQLHDTTPPVAGAFMFSGLYDVPTLHKGPLELKYYGEDDSRAEEQSALPGLIASDVPMLFTVAEHDPANFQKQAAVLVERWFAAKQAYPRMIHMPDSNHLSAALGIGGADRLLAPEIVAFIERFSPPA